MTRNRKSKSQKGSALVLTMLALIPICGMVGLVADIGWSYYTKGTAQAASDAAAIAVVRSAMDYVAAGASYDCSSSSVVCQAATNCPSVIPSPMTNNIQNGCAYAGSNGFSSAGAGGSQTLTMEANNTTHAPTAPGVKVSYWVTARISKVNPLSFLAVLGFSNATIGARSTAALVNKVPPACIVALDPSASSALLLSGNPTVALSNCAAQVNSSDPNAINVGGSACLTADAVNVVGGGSTTGCTTPVTTVPKPISDPFAGLAPPPSATQPCDYTSTPSSSTLSPGVYCGGLNIQSTVTLLPGTYILKGGGLSCNANCAMSSPTGGVTFYNTCNSGLCGGGSAGYSGLKINGGGILNLSAPTGGDLSGILFFQDRTVSKLQDDKILGGSNATLQGVVYFPNSVLTFAGNFGGANASTVLIADKVAFKGNSSLQLSATGPTPAWAPTVSLIE
jgi:Flp pilus assembly protein TadG